MKDFFFKAYINDIEKERDKKVRLSGRGTERNSVRESERERERK